MKNSIFNAVCKTRYLALLVVLIFTCGNAWGAVPSGWSKVTALSGIAAGDKIIIVTNDGNNYLNGSLSSGHFSVTALDASHPANASAAGVITLEATGTADQYKLKFVSTSRYMTATAASSGKGSISATSDSYGWKFTLSSEGLFNAQYQESGKQAYCRSYSNNTFRTYSGTSNGNPFQIYKYSATYTITAVSNNASYGSVSLSGTTITATPKSGYKVPTTGGYTVTSGSAIVTNNGDGTFSVSPTSNCTVQINFEAKTAASITFVNPGTPAPTTSGYYVGDSYTLPSTNNFTCGTKTFVGWSTVEISTPSVSQPVSNFYAPGANVTLAASQTFYAVFATSTGSGTKWVLTDLGNADAGTYALLTNSYYAFNGSISNQGHGEVTASAFSFTNGEAASAPSGTCEIEFVEVTGGFKMYNSATSKYLYAKAASSGNLAWSASESSYWSCGETGNWTYEHKSAYLRSYSDASIRTYGNNSGVLLKLAKKVAASSYTGYTTSCESTFTVTYNGNGNTSGSVPTDATAYNSGETVTVKGNTGSLVKTGYAFGGWNTQADGNGTNYTAGSGTFTISSNTTLYAKWTPNNYTVTWMVNGSNYSEGGSTSVNHGSKVTTLPTAPDPGDYCGDVFVGWTDEEYSGNSAPTHLYKTASEFPNATGNQTFYAVFADYAD